MEHKLSHQQKIFQKMVLTSKMKHSIQLLGMSVKDLNDYIETVLVSNPFLEKKSEKQPIKKYENGRSLLSNRTSSFEYNDNIANIEDAEPRESLLSQVRMLNLDKKDIEIAEYLIYELDENGYIKSSVEDIARDVFADIEKVQEVLEVIQGLEPAGIGARDIRECLQLQLKRLKKEDSLEYAIVTNFISDLAINDIPKIAKSLSVDKELVKQAVDTIKKLNPRPGSTLLSKGTEWAIPDLIVTVKDEEVRLELNRETIPRLRLFNPFENQADDPEVKKFVKENMESAAHLIDNIKRREETMCKVARYVLDFHRDELINDADERKSLTIKEISLALGLHPSTINRTVSNKYMQIDNKVVSLKSFLSHGIKKENGDITSKTNVKKRIEELVKSEDKKRPLTDKAVQEKLAEQGITIKRRTVAKYRGALRILPTYLRKKVD